MTKPTESVLPGEDEAVKIIMDNCFGKFASYLENHEYFKQRATMAYRALAKLTPQAGGSHD